MKIDRRNFVISSLGIAGATLVSTTIQAEDNKLQKLPFLKYDESIKNAPFGERVGASISYYNRVSPYIANAGLLQKGGLEDAKQLGFKLIVDLRKPDEKGVKREMAAAKELGIDYLNIPVASRAPEWGQVDQLASVIGNTKNYPILIHCVSSNRSGAIWALYRARMGVPTEIAIQEGRCSGLESREQAVRNRLGIS